MTSALVAGVFPDDVAVVVSEIGDVTHELWPEEATLVAGAVIKRRREFARGRVNARQALSLLGVPPASLLVGTKREPLWPEGIVGSITHDETLCVVAVANAQTYAGIGVDIEPEGVLEPTVAARIWSPAEAKHAARRTDMSEALASRLVFSAKEAFYKCQYPLTRTFVGFKEVSVQLGDQTFELRLENAIADLPAGARFSGTWRRAENKLLTAIVLRRGDLPRRAS
jgi:4'-phosphopantetheinyl transferase EntD